MKIDFMKIGKNGRMEMTLHYMIAVMTMESMNVLRYLRMLKAQPELDRMPSSFTVSVVLATLEEILKRRE